MRSITIEIGILSSTVSPTPRSPDNRPMMNVSALKTFVTSRLLAPMARRMPISLTRSRTEIYVMMPIMMLLTTREMLTNAIST